MKTEISSLLYVNLCLQEKPINWKQLTWDAQKANAHMNRTTKQQQQNIEQEAMMGSKQNTHKTNIITAHIHI